MATAAQDRLVSQGWRYDPLANGVGGYVRGDTRWDPQTQRFVSTGGLGGSIFVPRTAMASGSTTTALSGGSAGVSAVAAPAMPSVSAPQSVSASMVAAPAPVTARPVTAREASWQAPDANAFGVSDVRAERVDPFMVEAPEILRQLDQQAQEELALGGRLSAQEVRDTQQSARAAFAARGMVHSNPAAMAEVLARDTFARQRQNERRNFAAGVSGMLTGIDQGNQAAYNQVETANANRMLDAGRSNQSTRLQQWQTGAEGGLRVSLQNASEGNRVALQNEANRLNAGQFNVDAGLRASMANQDAGLRAGIANQGAGLDFARLGIDSALGGFNAATGRMNAETGRYQALNPNYGNNGNWQAQAIAEAQQRQREREIAAGMMAGSGAAGSTYVPLGTNVYRGVGYRALGS